MLAALGNVGQTDWVIQASEFSGLQQNPDADLGAS
jgi:hypothetical protein